MAKRYEGRLFILDGVLHFVTEVDEQAREARVSRRAAGETQILNMPLTEVATHLASCSEIKLDNLHSPEAAQRVVEQEDGWYFVTREGEQGPYAEEQQAQEALRAFILRVQSAA